MAKRGRPRKGAKIEEKIKQYLKDYELDELNASNDMSSLRQMCALELRIEQINEALELMDAEDDPSKFRSLISALKDATLAYTNLQDELGISRKKRASETEENPVAFIEQLKKDAKTFIDRRLIQVKCETCKLLLAKYHIYVYHKAEGDSGVPSSPSSVNAQKTPPEPIYWQFEIECPQCSKLIVHKNET